MSMVLCREYSACELRPAVSFAQRPVFDRAAEEESNASPKFEKVPCVVVMIRDIPARCGAQKKILRTKLQHVHFIFLFSLRRASSRCLAERCTPLFRPSSVQHPRPFYPE